MVGDGAPTATELLPPGSVFTSPARDVGYGGGERILEPSGDEDEALELGDRTCK